ncbi:hypothetical protein E2C01_013137 [Portunus trituberculatus]|uniref:Uncharacterized protein n=1 Tax=Portunus trituberculatus TaxID=210409 RepID=A0A5B7DFH2_PORTR|nr:hypothetical protein [Portunus trituberculatus]
MKGGSAGGVEQAKVCQSGWQLMKGVPSERVFAPPRVSKYEYLVVGGRSSWFLIARTIVGTALSWYRSVREVDCAAVLGGGGLVDWRVDELVAS